MSVDNCPLHNKLLQVRPKALTWCQSKEDRFIPRRGSLNLARFNLFNNDSDLHLDEKTKLAMEFSEMLKEGLVEREDSKDKIAFFKYRESRKGKQTKKFEKPKRAKKRFTLPEKPFKVLDAPEMSDNYYLNLLDWSSKGQLAICLNNSIYLLNESGGEINKLYEAFDCEAISSLRWNEEGDKLCVGNILGQLGVWDVSEKTEIHSLDVHTDRIAALDWKGTLLSGSKDSRIIQNDFRIKRSTIATFKGHTQEVCQLRWSPDSQLFASGGNDNKLCIWSTQNAKPIMTESHLACVKAIAWSKNQYGLLASGGGTADRCIKTWNVNTKEMLYSRDTGSQVCSLQYSKHTNDIISSHGYPNNEISIWRANGLKKVGSLLGHEERVLHTNLSPCGTVLLSSASDDTLRFWKLYDIKNDVDSKKELGLSMKSKLR